MNNIPFVTILLAMVGSVVVLLLGKREKTARILMQLLFAAVAVASFTLIPYFLKNGGTVTYTLGHFPSPWGNELRFGLMESILAFVFSLILLLAVGAGKKGIGEDVKSCKRHLDCSGFSGYPMERYPGRYNNAMEESKYGYESFNGKTGQGGI